MQMLRTKFTVKLKMYRELVFYFLLALRFSSSIASETGFFWHVSDIHVDHNYSRVGNPQKLCHIEESLYPDNGLYGNFLCDSPEYLVNVTFKAMKKIKPDPDFIIWTGDNLPHTVTFNPEWNVIYEVLYNITVLFNETFPGIPVFPCIGNHDTFPPNMLLPNETSNSIYQDILTKGGWNKYLDKESALSFKKGGYFSQILQPGLRIISLNTILWYTPNYFTKKMLDPAGQFEWLEEVLRSSLRQSEKVYIIGHVPPGFYNRVIPGSKSDPTYHSQYLKAYINILKKYSKIILGQMFGHLHMDMFQIFQTGSGQFKSSSILASSVSPWHFESVDNVSMPVNPSIRLMHYETSNGLLKDYDQFYLNLTKANEMSKSKEPDNLYEWLYTFTKAYGVSDLSTGSLVEVYEKIKANNTLFDMFFKFSTAGKESVPCDTFCKVAQLCSISSISTEEYDMCMKNSSTSNGMCREVYVIKDYSKLPFYILAILISCVSIGLLFFICQRHRRSNSEIYTKLLGGF